MDLSQTIGIEGWCFSSRRRQKLFPNWIITTCGRGERLYVAKKSTACPRGILAVVVNKSRFVIFLYSQTARDAAARLQKKKPKVLEPRTEQQKKTLKLNWWPNNGQDRAPTVHWNPSRGRNQLQNLLNLMFKYVCEPCWEDVALGDSSLHCDEHEPCLFRDNPHTQSPAAENTHKSTKYELIPQYYFSLLLWTTDPGCFRKLLGLKIWHCIVLTRF